MAYTKEIREQVLRDLESGISVGKISRTYQISVPTIYSWKRKYLENPDLTEELASNESLTEENTENTEISSQENETMTREEVRDKISSLIGDNLLEEALNICNHPLYKDDRYILSKKVDILVRMSAVDQDIEKVMEAYQICRKPGLERDTRFNKTLIELVHKFPNLKSEEFPILNLSPGRLMTTPTPEVVKQVRRLIFFEYWEEALDICNYFSYRNNTNIVVQQVKALFYLGNRDNDLEKIKKCYRLCLSIQGKQNMDVLIQKIKSGYPDVDWSLYQPHVKKTTEVSKTIEASKQLSSNPLDKKQRSIVINLLSKIYCDFITTSEIESAELDDWNKDLLSLAYSHKHSREHAMALAKKLKQKYSEDENKIRILNQLLERIKIKKGINFDIREYNRCLGVSLSFELVSQILKKKALQEEAQSQIKPAPVKNLQIVSPVSQARVDRKPEKRMVVVEGKPVTARYQQSTSSIKGGESQKNKELKIKDVFESEILQIGRQLYLQMGDPRNVKRGCDAWDQLEILKEKSASDADAIIRIVNIISRINLKVPNFIKTNEQRNDRLYQEAEEKKEAEEKEKQKFKKYSSSN